MCETCWQEAGRPSIIDDEVRAVRRMIDRADESGISCELTRIVIEDWNVDDGNLETALKELRELVLGVEMMLKMPAEKRLSALALADGLIQDDREVEDVSRET